MKMYSSFTIVFTLSFVAGYVACAKDSGDLMPEKLGKEFRELDKLLTRKINTDNAIANMNKVRRLIPKAESSNILGFKNKKNLATAEKLFLSLTKLEDKKMCSRDGFKICTDNAKAIKAAGTPARVGEVFAYYIERLQEICMRVYPEMLRGRLASMDQDKLERLDYLMERSMFMDRRGKTDATGIFALIRLNHVGPKLESLIKTLKNIPQDIVDDPKFVKRVESDYLQEEVAYRYLIEPCDHLILNLGEDIFALVSTWVPIHTPDINQYEFYYNWARYKFCSNAYKIISDLRGR